MRKFKFKFKKKNEKCDQLSMLNKFFEISMKLRRKFDKLKSLKKEKKSSLGEIRENCIVLNYMTVVNLGSKTMK
jgi:hypothetical protein